MADGAKLPSWSQILLAAVLVALVGGAFWLKSRPKIPIGATAGLESVSSILAQGIQAHNAQQTSRQWSFTIMCWRWTPDTLSPITT